MNKRDVLLTEQDTTLVPNSYTLLRGFINKAWLGFGGKSLGLGSAKTGLASARLYYTAPYRFSVSMFRAPVLSYTGLGLGLGLAWA